MTDIALRSWAREACASGELLQVRRNARLSALELGELVGVTGPAVSRWERGLRTPRGEAAERLARVIMELAERTEANRAITEGQSPRLYRAIAAAVRAYGRGAVQVIVEDYEVTPATARAWISWSLTHPVRSEELSHAEP